MNERPQTAAPAISRTEHVPVTLRIGGVEITGRRIGGRTVIVSPQIADSQKRESIPKTEKAEGGA